MLSIRKTNILGLLETEVVIVRPVLDEEEKEIGQQFVTNENFMGEEREITNDVLIEIAEMLSAAKELPFSFTFHADAEEYPWSGGIYKMNDPIPFPTNEEEAAKLDGTPMERFTDKWMNPEPEISVFDKDMPNLLCQLVTALSELFVESIFEKEPA